MSRSHRVGLGSIASVALLISLVAAPHARSEHGASNAPPACGIYFRSGAVLVKVGVYPLPTDSALATAARLMVSRM